MENDIHSINDHYHVIHEEADETSSVGSGITPRRLEEEEEELARINEELTSRSHKEPWYIREDKTSKPEIVF